VIWAAVLAASAGCFALKLAGWSVPARWLAGERLQMESSITVLTQKLRQTRLICIRV